MPEPATGQTIAGKYRLESLIGHGGMGSVWHARHLSLDMPVAIKFMGAHADADLESRQRFDREARALASLRTPHIVQVLDHGVDDDTPYIVMEYLDGEDLSSRLLRKKRLGLDETSRILAQTARGLRRAHDAGVTHRDLKPSNIFLARIDDEEIVKVLDFGVAKLAATGALGDQLTKTGTLLGSPGYMSPEQARGKEVDFRSDLWALAVIVFRAVTGVKPFSGDSIAELVIKLCIDPRPVASRFAPDLPPNVDRFFEKAFAANPEERFASAMEMATAFATWVGQPGIEVSRSGPSPVAGLSANVLDAPALPGAAQATSGSMPAASPAANAPLTAPAQPAASHGASGFGPGAPAGSVATGVTGPFAAPATAGGHASTAAPAGTVVVQGAPGVLPPPRGPLAPPGSLLAASREPTPTPASFAGFAPSGAETASAPPAAGPTVPFPEGALRPPGVPSPGVHNARGSDGPDAPTPTGMRLYPPGPPAAPAKPAAPPGAPATLDLKTILFAAAGAAVLAIFFAMAIAGLKRRHTNALRPDERDSDSPPVASSIVTATTAPTEPPASTASADAVPSADPASASATASADPAATAAPSASQDPSAAPSDAPVAGPVVVEGPVEPAPSATTTSAVAPRPTSSTRSTGASAPTTKSSGKTAPTATGSAKKKNPKPNFGY